MELTLSLQLKLEDECDCGENLFVEASPPSSLPQLETFSSKRDVFGLYLALSVAVHALIFFIPSAPPDAPPKVAIELTLATLGGIPGSGERAGLSGKSAASLMRSDVPAPSSPRSPEVAAVPQAIETAPASANLPTSVPKKKISRTDTQRSASREIPRQHPRNQTPPIASLETSPAIDQPTDSPPSGASDLVARGGGSGAALGVAGGQGGARANAGSGSDGPGRGDRGGRSNQAFDFGDVNGPSFLHRARPVYPRLAVARKEQGVVVLLLHLDEAGRVQDVTVSTSAGPRLDEAAVQAARASSYAPALIDGTPSSCTARLPIQFTLAGIL